MSRVDFYILPQGQKRQQFVARLVEKLYRDKHEVLIHTDDESTAREIDQLIWSAHDISFIPHELVGNGEAAVMIGVNDEIRHGDVVVNLAEDTPAFFSHYPRIVEVVDPDPALKRQSRNHFKHYQANGLEIHSHDLDAT